MAYSKILDRTCRYEGCVANASREVFRKNDAPVGEFCTRHAERVLREVDAEERKPKPQKEAE